MQLNDIQLVNQADEAEKEWLRVEKVPTPWPGQGGKVAPAQPDEIDR